MVKRCVSAGCSKTYRDGVSLYAFPRDPSIRQQWVKQVQRTRAQWSGPTEHSVLCSPHFDDSCFEPDSALAAKMGLVKRRRLKPDAVPTVLERPAPGRLRSSGEAGYTSVSAAGSSHKSSASTLDTDTPSQPKRSRTVYEKIERARVSKDTLNMVVIGTGGRVSM